MNCEQMNELLSAWLDGELSGNEQRQMQAHLEQCAQCWALFEQLQALHTSFAELEEIPAPDGFAEGVMNRVKAESESRAKVIPLFKRPQMRGLAAMAACALLCVGLGSGLLSGRSEEGAAPAPEAAAPEAAGYVLDSTAPASGDAAVENRVEEPAECAPQAPGAAEVPAMEPAAPAPEISVQTTQGDPFPVESKIAADSVGKEACEIVLRRLPEGLEDGLGQLAWEERLEDGARCARLSVEQAQILMDMVKKQELDYETRPGEGGAEENWILVLLPD